MKKMKHDKPKGQWKKLVKKTAALIAAAAVLAGTEGVTGIETPPVVTAEAAETHKLGNSVTNQLLGGSSVEYKGRIYFGDYNDKGYPCIYSVKKDGTQKKNVFTDEGTSLIWGRTFDHMVFCKGYIFARCNTWDLVRVKPDGTGYKCWKESGSIDEIAAADGKIYYSGNKGIYSMNPDGTNKKKLLKQKGYSISLEAVDGKHIYYSRDYSDIYRCDMNGKNQKKLLTSCYGICGLSGEKLYYCDGENRNIYSLDMKTGKKKKIYAQKVYRSETFAYNGNLYIPNDGKGYTKVEIKTGKKTTVWPEVGLVLGIHGDVMMYETWENDKVKIVLATVKGRKIKTVNSYDIVDDVS